MITNYLLLCFFGVLACFVARTVAVVGGAKAGVDQFQYQVTIKSTEGGYNICGGAIISDSHVLTAAHCLIESNNRFTNIHLSILAGTNDLRGHSVRSVTAYIAKIYVPKEYKPPYRTSTHDIAVIKLKEPLRLESYHKYLKVLKVPSHNRETYANEQAIVAGHGFNWVKDFDYRNGGENEDTILRFAYADILVNNLCLPEQTKLSTKHLCARVKQNGSHPRGVCYGDDGSPLVYGDTVVGVLSSATYSCQERFFPAVYTRVSDYLEFIHNAMRDRTWGIRTHRP